MVLWVVKDFSILSEIIKIMTQEAFPETKEQILSNFNHFLDKYNQQESGIITKEE